MNAVTMFNLVSSGAGDRGEDNRDHSAQQPHQRLRRWSFSTKGGRQGSGGSLPPNIVIGRLEEDLVLERRKLREAELKILSLERTRDADTKRLWDLQERLNESRAASDAERTRNQLETSRLRREKEAAEEQRLALERELRDEGRMGDYAALVDEVANRRDARSCDGGVGGVDGGDAEVDEEERRREVAARLRRHLTRALHKMEVMTNEIASVRASCDRVTKRLREDADRALEERSRVEVDLMNQLAMLKLEHQDDEEKRREETVRYQQEIRELQKQLDGYEELFRAVETHQTSDKNGGDGRNTAASERRPTETKAKLRPDAAPVPDNAAWFKSKAPASPDAQLQEVVRAKDEMESSFRNELKERDRMIAWLEEENFVKERLIKKLSASGGSSAAGSAELSLGSGMSGSVSSGLNSIHEAGEVAEAGGNELSLDDIGGANTQWVGHLDSSLMGMCFSMQPTHGSAMRMSAGTLEGNSSGPKDKEDHAKECPASQQPAETAPLAQQPAETSPSAQQPADATPASEQPQPEGEPTSQSV